MNGDRLLLVAKAKLTEDILSTDVTNAANPDDKTWLATDKLHKVEWTINANHLRNNATDRTNDH